MIEFLQQVFSGLATGSIYACFALALVLMYKSTRVINFAQGNMAALGACIALWLIEEQKYSFWPAMGIVIVISFIMGYVVQRGLSKLTQATSHLAAIMATLGLALLFESLAGYKFGYENKAFPSPFPAEPLKIGPFMFSMHDVGMMGVTLGLMLFVYLLFKYTNLGLAMRAVSQNIPSSSLVGINVTRTFAVGWGIASVIGAIAGGLIAPVVFVYPQMMNTVIIYAFAAAILGGLESPLGAVVGGLLIGVIENMAGSYVPFLGTKLKMSAALFVIVIVLIFKPEGLFGKQTRASLDGFMAAHRKLGASFDNVFDSIPRWGKVLFMVALIAFAYSVPMFAESFMVFQLANASVIAAALIGLNLITGNNGQLCLGHGAFYGIGAYVTAIMVVTFHMHIIPSIIAGGVICLLLGFLFGLPISKLEGPSLAAATITLGVVVPQIFQRFDNWTGGSMGMAIERPKGPEMTGWDEDRWGYYIAVTFLLIVAFFVRNILSGRVGRAIEAIREAPAAARSMGIDDQFYKAITFGVGALFTGLAGGVGAILIGHVSPEGFQLHLSFIFMVGIVVGGLASIPGSILGALFIQFVPTYTEDIHKSLTAALFGLIIIGVLTIMPSGFYGGIKSLVHFILLRFKKTKV